MRLVILLMLVVCLRLPPRRLRIEGGCAMLAGILASAILSTVSVAQNGYLAAHLQDVFPQRSNIWHCHTGNTAIRQ